MGYLKNKYTKEYFTGVDKDGNELNYGVEGYKEFLKGKIRPIDLSILNQINFKNKKVLELGCGRGEAIKYGIDNGAIEYDAVDFSKDAVNIAKEFLKSKKIKNVNLYCNDALLFLKKLVKKEINNKKFDIIIMFDFIEHVPRSELKEILFLLKKIIKTKSIIAINTPNYFFDNDVIKNGLDQRNNINTIDTSDINEATSGMHCNKYSTVSLQIFMRNSGYLNITEQHFFISKKINNFYRYQSYQSIWTNCFKNKFPILEKYKNDIVETAYTTNPKPEWIKFYNGLLNKINLFITKTYASAVYPNGKFDTQMFNDFKKNTNHKEIIFDVGGFIGVSSLLFSKIVGQKGKIISFEPNPYNLNRMLFNFSQNTGLNSNIYTINTALSDKTEEVEFLLSANIDNGHSSTSRLLNTHVEHSQKELEDMGFFKQKVNQDTLDNFIKKNKILPNIIKVDIEGAEHLFLLGAKRFLKSHSPVLYIELHSQYCALKCTEIMNLLGYENTIIFEEPDNRILVKYYKTNSNKIRNNIGINRIEEKIIKDRVNSLENKITILNCQNIELGNKISTTNEQISNLIIEKKEIINKFKKLENYLIKIINNPIIKTEIKMFRLLKKITNHF
jgi:FkbM family methyltransferase